MIGYFTPILYDFKRSFIRLSTLLLLIIFIVSGIGLVYLVYVNISQYRPLIDIIAIAIDTNNTCLFTGIVFDIKGELIDNVNIVFKIRNEIKYSIVVSKYFEYSDTKICEILREAPMIELRSSIGVNDRVPGVGNPIYVNGSYIGIYYMVGYAGRIPEYSAITIPIRQGFQSKDIESSIREGDYEILVMYRVLFLERFRARAIFLGVDFSREDFKPNIKLYCLFKQSSSANEGELYEIGVLSDMRYLIKDIDLKSGFNYIVIRVVKNSIVLESQSIPISVTYTLEAQSINLLTSNIGLALFEQFFPIVFIYLAYTLLAKPRSTGALEFVLARPITKWNIYITRYLAGVLTALVSTTVFLLVMNLSYLILFGITLDLYSNILIFIGLIGTLIVFYTLCYMIASSLRSGQYLAISITLYILFALLWSVIVVFITFTTGPPDLERLIENSYRLSYFNPLSPIDWAQYYVQKHYGVELIPLTSGVDIDKILNPYLVIITPLLWISICFTIGYIVFKRTVLTS
ncbi:MAG: ABC transporter permease subunit [Desulfurococcaceae archaeon]